MKTAMQELVEWVERRDFYLSKEWLNALLEKEKQQIIDAYKCGDNEQTCDDNAINYYNQTFKD